MRLISFALTKPQFLDRSKTVTRRNGWLWLVEAFKANPEKEFLLCGVEKAMGLKKGESVNRLATIRVVSVRREPIEDIMPEDVVAEGFPDWTPGKFVAFYCKANRCKPSDLCTRIEFEHVR